MNAHLRNPIMVRPTSSGLINTLYLFLSAIWVPPSYPLLSLSSLFIFDHLPSAYLLAHNCETSWGLLKFSFVFTFVCDQFPLIPITRLVSLAPLMVASLVSSATKHIPRTVLIRSQPMSFSSMQNLFGCLALLPLSVSPSLLYSLFFLALISFSLFRHYVLSLNSHIYMELRFLCLRGILVPCFSISSSHFWICWRIAHYQTLLSGRFWFLDG